MTESRRIHLREVPSDVRGRLLRRRGGAPDMDITTGPTKAVVVFHANDEGVAAYHLIGKTGKALDVRVLVEPTHEAAVQRVLGEVFSNDQTTREPIQAMDFTRYGGKPS